MEDMIYFYGYFPLEKLRLINEKCNELANLTVVGENIAHELFALKMPPQV